MVVIVATPDASGKMGETAFATPTETLQRVCTDLQIPDMNPYRGLNPFTEAQAKFFFGRKQEVDRLVNKLRLDPRFLLIVGPSGSGKSSLVQAGLIPQLRAGALPGSECWHIMLTRPADLPFQQLTEQGLTTESNNLTQAVRAWLNQHPEDTQIVLFLDQFEDLLVNRPEEMSQDFLAQLAALLDANLPITVIAIMRDDFYTHFAQQVKLAQRLEQNGGLIHISPTLQWDELVAIVQEPARAVGLRFEEGLAEEIVEDKERILRVRVQEQGQELVGPWFVHAELLPVLERLEQQVWEPKTTLLSPFDNLICDRKRTARLFDFTYRSEIYTPKNKRQFGYYVMPILCGDQLIGRIDPTFDRGRKRLIVNAVHAEPATSITGETGQAIAVAIEELAAFLGATTISYSHKMPEGWKQILT